MAQHCAVCNHEFREQIEKEMIKGANLTELSKKYNISYFSVYRHSKHHLLKDVSVELIESRQEIAQNLINELEKVLTDAKNIYERASKKGNDNVALKACSEIRSSLEMLARTNYSIKQVEQLQQENERLKIEIEGEQGPEVLIQQANKLKVLTMNELIFLSRINKKIEKQDINDVILPDGNGILFEKTDRSNNNIIRLKEDKKI